MDFGLKNIIEYRESGSGSAIDALPFITELPRRRLPDSEKEMVIAYLRNNSFIQWKNFGKPLTDAFVGQDMPAWGYVLTDGEYTWTDDLVIYVERYDVELPRSFVEHVKQQSGRISGNSA